MKLKYTAMVLFLCSLPGLCIAEPSYKGETCPPAGESTSQRVMTECEGSLAEKADKDLNAIYQELYKLRKHDFQLDNADLLKNAELAWIKLRDKQCEWVGNRTIGGTINGQVFAECKLLMTKQRIEELKKFLACRDNDIFCGAE